MTRSRTSLLYNCIGVLTLFSCITLRAQNLVPNYSFETITQCPSAYGTGGASFAPPWVAPTWGTSDIFNACATFPQVDVPLNNFGIQPALTGDGYAGFYARFSNFEYREYLHTKLIDTLEAGQWYYISFFVSKSEHGCGVKQLGLLFTPDSISIPDFLHIPGPPQIETDGDWIVDEVNWTLISGCYLATGNEAYITIGNFHPDPGSVYNPDCETNSYSYYYVEDVSVVPGFAPEPLEFDLGDPVEACFEYEIDPGLSDYIFIWEDGSHGPTFTVTASGTYSLTITDGCNFGEDSIEVTILGFAPPVDIPDAEVVLCSGDEYEISLDPGLYEYTWQDGSNDASYTITASGIYSVTLDDGCVASEDQVEVIFMDPVQPFSLGDEYYLCPDSTITLSFDPALGDFTWQDNSTAASFTIDDNGAYSLTISNVCNEESASVIVFDQFAPYIELGPDSMLLCPGQTFNLDFDPDLGSFFWQDSSVNSFYSITMAGTYAVSVTNQCGTADDQMIVLPGQLPAFDLGADRVLCPGDSITLDGDNSPGSYLWQDGTTSSTQLVTTAGTYSLQVTTSCGIKADTVNVLYEALVTPPDLGPDVTLCPGEQLTLTINDPNASFLWQDGSTSNQYVINAAGTYHVTAYNACGLFADTISVTVNAEPPVVDLLPTVTLCQGQSYTIEAGVSGVSYVWNDNSNGSALIVSSPGTYSITVSNACGTDTDSILVVDGGPAPIVDLGNDISICPGDVIAITPSSSAVDNWLWHDGSTGNTILIDAAGTASVIVSNGCGEAVDTLNTTLLPETPVFSLGNDTAVCPGGIVLLQIAVEDVSITWSDGSAQQDFTATEAGEYFATIANTCGEFADTIQITSLPAVPPLDLGSDQTLCPGEVFIIDPGIDDVQYLWQDGSAGTSFSTMQGGTFVLSISNACGTSTDTLVITESTTGPDVNLGPDITGCAGDEVVIQAGVSGVDYLWQDGSTLSAYTTTVSGQFILNVSNNCGADADTIEVDLSAVPPSVMLGVDTLLCDGATLSLQLDVDAGSVIVWQDGTTTSDYLINEAGLYHASVSNHCGSAADSMAVETLLSPAAFDLGNDTALCIGTQIVLYAPVTTDAWMWQDGSAADSIIADQSQVYSLQISNACGTAYDEMQLTYIGDQPTFDFDEVVPICPGDTIALNALQSFPAAYLWSTGAISPAIRIASPGIYAITIITDCFTASEEVIVSADECKPVTQFYIPNIFSPNGDGLNDVFEIHFNETAIVESVSGQVYDRWGNLLFASDQIPFRWDGTFNGTPMNPGVYVYAFVIRYSNGRDYFTERLTGDVTVMK